MLRTEGVIGRLSITPNEASLPSLAYSIDTELVLSRNSRLCGFYICYWFKLLFTFNAAYYYAQVAGCCGLPDVFSYKTRTTACVWYAKFPASAWRRFSVNRRVEFEKQRFGGGGCVSICIRDIRARSMLIVDKICWRYSGRGLQFFPMHPRVSSTVDYFCVFTSWCCNNKICDCACAI